MELNCIFNNFLTFKKRNQLNYFTDKSFTILFLLNTIKFYFGEFALKFLKKYNLYL